MTNKKCSGKRCPLDSTAYNEDCTAVDHCKWFTPKIVTNRQWLESLSDEELAENIGGCGCCIYDGTSDCRNKDDTCKSARIKWLEAKHKESE